MQSPIPNLLLPRYMYSVRVENTDSQFEEMLSADENTVASDPL
jgi:hypothetical protein